jgi:hypothetical protein
MHMANMLLELKNHIQQTYPYWNRTQVRCRGADIDMLSWTCCPRHAGQDMLA